MRRLLTIVVGVLVGAAVLSGCASLPPAMTAHVPTTGPITQGEQVGGRSEDQFIRVIARSPRPGMTPLQVVQGFLDASASFEGDHAVARQYLTKPASMTWNTNAGVQAYDGAPSLTELGQTIAMSAVESESIASNGHLQVSGPAASMRENFHVTKEEGEWRLDEVPQGLLLSQSDVDRAFRSYDIYFFNPDFDSLVPDPRMIPVIGPGLATTLVRRLLAGPSDWLEPAVRTGFPAGVKLNIDAVPIESGVARVDLTGQARQADDQTRRAMSQQIVWTLRQIPEVKSVEITSLGQPLTMPGVPSPQGRDFWSTWDPDRMPTMTSGYVVRDTGVSRLGSLGVRSILGAAGTTEAGFVDLAISPDEKSVAGIRPDGSIWTARMSDGAPLIQILPPGTRSGLAFSNSGAVWVVDGDRGLLSVQGDGSTDEIAVEGLAKKTRLIAAIPSRDGTRAALIIRRGPRTGIVVGRVVQRSGGGTALTIGDPVRVESGLVEVIDASWSSSDSIAVLGSESAGLLQVFTIDIARGVSVSQGTPEGPVAIAAAPGMATLVASIDGLVYESSAGSWRERARGFAPAYPG